MKQGYQTYLYLILLFAHLYSPLIALSQSYGLAFSSYEAVQDSRTALDLTPDRELCLSNNFELSFDLALISGQPEYFGYVFRLIDNNKNNIDLVCDNATGISRNFTLVAGSSSSVIRFDEPDITAFNTWNKVILKADLAHHTLTFNLGPKKIIQRINTGQGNCYKILFGANNFGTFKTTDVPPMRIRNIIIKENKVPKYGWALNEAEGDIALDSISGKNARVNNPLWIKKMHYDWEVCAKMTVQGAASVAFNKKDEQIYIVGLDSLYTFSVGNNHVNSLKYKSGRLNLLEGNQSYFDDSRSKLYTIYLDQRQFVTFDFSTQTWSGNFDTSGPITDNWHFNKFYAPSDSSFYIFNGYGHYVYKNDIKRYHLPDENLQDIMPANEVYSPRYLAALGVTDDGAYIIGGYGSKSGQQILNPKNWYDLLYFSLKDRRVKKCYELKSQGEDFVFANSLVIDSKTRSYYGLVFPKHKFNTALQLIKGSLDTASFIPVGDTISYKFHDIQSFADLYYCPTSGKFIAVTLFHNERDQTEVVIYALASPPLKADLKFIPASSAVTRKWVLFLLAGCLVLIGLFIAVRKRRLKQNLANIQPVHAGGEAVAMLREQSAVPSTEDTGVKATEPMAAVNLTSGVENLHETYPAKDEEAVTRNAIYLFGGMQLFDNEGNDITRLFTPLIKELFLVILLYTIRWERGISSEKLKELLWFDKTAESARNNRSVNIAKLKSILDKMQSCQISKETGYWKINADYSQLQVDYHKYLTIVKDKGKLDKHKIQQLAEITQRGSFLSNVEYEWLDSFKSEISNDVIDTYLHFANAIEVTDDPEFLVKIANYIFYFDPVNEEAMVIKCKALVCLGKHSLAKNTFESFCREYKLLYDEDFEKSFQEILE
ncbi:galactose oxidase [Pedobacter sp. BS3]|uniref:galactose oxidase n=1 Tax=Pedobacter sp. BS3 TaxID=2567937 RepID=UPI0011EBB515|nr:galactose oxidase [Pedobacter sp. BS3]TZF81011.1 galactose oxidase [Pedobacter sp. BS3]